MKKNRRFFNKVLNDVSSAGAGYNLRYKVVNMLDFGLPQKRKRLVIIAAKYIYTRYPVLFPFADIPKERFTAASIPKANSWSCWQWSETLCHYR